MEALSVFAINVQSPPETRAKALAKELINENAHILVLSELSHAKGSELLMELLRKAGYHTHWTTPSPGDFSAAVATRIDNVRPVRWRGELSNRASFVSVTLNEFVLVLGGLYVPSLNLKNTGRRSVFFEAMRDLLLMLEQRPKACVILGGDINCIPRWHVPPIPEFMREGYPFHTMMQELLMVDLNEQLNKPHEHTWFPPSGPGQLLDGFFIREAEIARISEYKLVHRYRQEKLSDHSAISFSVAV